MNRGNSNMIGSQPVFIIGAARSGTTWLGNTLARHFPVSIPQHQLHYGVKESNIYSNKKYWGNLSREDNFKHFFDNYTKGDFFILSKGEKTKYANRRFDTFYDFFFELMDAFAKQEGRRYWCTKLCPQFFVDKEELHLFLQKLDERYEKPKFIFIKREFDGYMNSYLNMSGNSYGKRSSAIGKKISVMLGVARYSNMNSEGLKLAENYKGLRLSYEELLKTTEEVKEKISTYLGVGIQKNSIPEFIRNSSFGKKKNKAEAKSYPWAKRMLSQKSLLGFLLKKYESTKKKSNPEYYRLWKAENEKEELIRDLEKSNDLDLVTYLRETKDFE